MDCPEGCFPCLSGLYSMSSQIYRLAGCKNCRSKSLHRLYSCLLHLFSLAGCLDCLSGYPVGLYVFLFYLSGYPDCLHEFLNVCLSVTAHTISSAVNGLSKCLISFLENLLWNRDPLSGYVYG